MGNESKLQDKILKHLKMNNHYCLKVVLSNSSGNPDIICCINGRFVGIEIKSEGKKASELQLYKLNQIQLSGGAGFVIDNFKDYLTIYNAIVWAIKAPHNDFIHKTTTNISDT